MGVIPTIYFCGYPNCSAKFKKKLRFESHERMHKGERPFICTHEGCNKSYTNASHLKRHQEMHGTRFRCKVDGCAMILKTKSTLKKHMDYFHGKKKSKTYKCTLCDAEFNKHNWLQRHMVRHTGEAPHVCPVEGCNKGFLLPSKLKRHMKIHQGYPCKNADCDEVFPNWSTLVKHMVKVHPVALNCEICDKAFSTRSTLKAHSVVHREQEEREIFECEVPNCSRFYFFRRNLKEHVKSFHKRRPFMCIKDDCNRAFKTEAELAEHIKYHGRKKPRHKKKNPKPTFAATLAGCVEPKAIKRNSASALATSESNEGCDSPVKIKVMIHQVDEEQTNSLSSERVLKNVSSNADVECDSDNSESCLGLLEGIINGDVRET